MDDGVLHTVPIHDVLRHAILFLIWLAEIFQII